MNKVLNIIIVIVIVIVVVVVVVIVIVIVIVIFLSPGQESMTSISLVQGHYLF